MRFCSSPSPSSSFLLLFFAAVAPPKKKGVANYFLYGFRIKKCKNFSKSKSPRYNRKATKTMERSTRKGMWCSRPRTDTANGCSSTGFP